MVDKVRIKWPDGKITELDSVKTNQTVIAHRNEGIADDAHATPRKRLLFQQQTNQDLKIDFKHTENAFVDFDRDRLTYQMLSTQARR